MEFSEFAEKLLSKDEDLLLSLGKMNGNLSDFEKNAYRKLKEGKNITTLEIDKIRFAFNNYYSI